MLMNGMSIDDWEELDRSNKTISDLCKKFIRPSEVKHAPPKEWLVPGILASGETSLVFGKPGCGKSVLATDLACRLASRLDMNGEEADVYRSVLYIAAERGDQVVRRVKAFEKRHGVTTRDLLIYSQPIDLSRRSDDLAFIIRAAEFHVDPGDHSSIDLVVVDTVSAAMSLPDSSTEATAAVAANVRRAIELTGAAVMLITHTPLNGEDRPRGGHLDGAADTTISVKKTLGTHTAKVVKNNDSGARPSLSFSVEGEVVGKERDGSDLTAAVMVHSAGKPDVTDAPDATQMSRSTRDGLATLATLAEDGKASEEAWRAAVYAATPDLKPASRRSAFNRARAGLIADGAITIEGDTVSILDSVAA